jgi:non-homologous end joining protein Ku
VATTLPYPDEVKDPSHFAELKDLPEAGEEELSMMTKIVDKMTKDLDLRVYHDGYKERIEALITSKMKGEVAQVEEEKPKKPCCQEHDGGSIKGDGGILEVSLPLFYVSKIFRI